MTHPRLLFVWLAMGVSAQAAETATIVFYVSPRGNDQWSGRLPAADAQHQDGPFATLSAARDAIRRLRRENRLAGPVEVLLLEGTYHLAEPFVLTAEDTGTKQQPITYGAYPGHHRAAAGPWIVLAPTLRSLRSSFALSIGVTCHLFSCTRSPRSPAAL